MFHLKRNTLILLSGIALIIISFTLFLTLNFTVIKSYHDESSFKKTTCTVRDVETHKMNSKEDWYKCPWKCTINHTPDGLKTSCELSEFPCLRIVVDVATKNGLKSAILHESPEKYRKFSDCSTYYCNMDSVVNEKDVNRFRKKYGIIGSKMSCYYNVDSLESDDYDDDGQEHALLRLTYNTASYVNSIIWPSLCGAAGIFMIFYALFFNFKSKKKSPY
ncbi:unnamed protein product [Brachionus calyciflorus]|uniref:Uncharacterized protein n=1 Tax=Brachionus calyciflorus TaxID=104777 RepID=A0A813M083_9BILA|nr:unnamed protein product [Brachionus calyciflorus]